MEKKLFMFILSIYQCFFWIDNFILNLLIKKKILKKFQIKWFHWQKKDEKV